MLTCPLNDGIIYLTGQNKKEGGTSMTQNFSDKDIKKKAWTLAMMYFKKCTSKGAFHNGKPSSQFFKVRSFFMQIDENSMLKLYKYMDKMIQTEMSLTDVFIAANELNAKEFAKKNTNTTIRQRDSFNLDKWFDDNA